ncbi:MAG: hypothetical protein M1825_002860 [Sarcosagium campestre]|nr:MAG: hypothetical protein M1825_002860 [Sarcosagium campestre]
MSTTISRKPIAEKDFISPEPPRPDPAGFNPDASLSDGPTESHALAIADHDEKGASQQEHAEPEVKDLGWDETATDVIVGGLPNEQLWTLIRRFDKQMYHVKAIPSAPPGGLDLNIADDEEFSPDKLRCNLERLYMTVIIGMIGFGKHIARLRSWREPRRTAAFATAYFAAWVFDFITPLIALTLIVLIVYPPSRTFLFPPAPLALVDQKSGGIKKPSAGVLGSHDSVTGAPEKNQGEAVEQEAHNFVSGLGAIGLSAATGKHSENVPHQQNSTLDSSVPDPTKLATRAADSKEVTAGGKPVDAHDKTKQPVEAAMWTKARPVMHILADIADGWERFANALSPTPPFPRDAARLRFAGIVAGLLAVSIVTTAYLFVKILTFSFGAAFFTDPLLVRGIALLNSKVPNWQQYLELRNSILKGVPTNAQLTITLLRVGESNKAPLPPPPSSAHPAPSGPAALDKSEVPLDASHGEIADAIHPDASDESTGPDADPKPAKHHGRHIVSMFKKSTRAGVTTLLGADRLKAAAGSDHARHRKGVLPRPDLPRSGPVDFQARFNGKRGRVHLSTAATIPLISFTPEPTSTAKSGEAESLKAPFSIAIADIAEVQKVGGFGWKAKLVVGWALDREIADGLAIVDVSGNRTVLTAIPLRDELFNRLIAMGGQIWESW